MVQRSLQPSFSSTHLHLALLVALGHIVLAPSIHAQIVVDTNAPNSQQPTVLEASNGVPLVNIQTPSAAGVSRNTYQQFDVNANGAILNNANTNIQTQLGGWVQGNPWLAQNTARVCQRSQPIKWHGGNCRSTRRISDRQSGRNYL